MKQLISRFILIGLSALLLGAAGNSLLKGFHPRFMIHVLTTFQAPPESMTAEADSAFAAFLSGNCDFVDIRSSLEYETDHVPGAVSFPYDTFVTRPDDLIRRLNGTDCIVYGDRSMTQKAFRTAKWIERGGIQTAILKNGYGAWLNLDFPVESSGEPL